nr:PREDICTED: CMRF35-like molecule 5 isoform X3 [Lepisosteus oculatus]
MQWEMRATVSTVCLLTVLGCVMSAERRVSGSEGGSVEIECNYPDGYQYKKKYWCRHPCGNKDVLIKTGKTDTVVSVGRFSLYDNVSFRTFTVTMSRLTLQDTGVYYCGLEQWGTDRLSEIHLRVRKHTQGINQSMTVSTLSTSMPVTVLMDITKTAAMDSSTQSAGGSNATSLVPGDQINQDSKVPPVSARNTNNLSMYHQASIHNTLQLTTGSPLKLSRTVYCVGSKPCGGCVHLCAGSCCSLHQKARKDVGSSG